MAAQPNLPTFLRFELTDHRMEVSHSGDPCEHSGTYCFDGYLDGSGQPRPAEDELFIDLEAGGLFPFIASVAKPCRWRLIEMVESPRNAPDRPRAVDSHGGDNHRATPPDDDPLDFLLPDDH